jgi:hypothetical protein
MVLHREGEIGPVHRSLLLFQLREGVVSVQLMQHVAVDIEEVAAVGTLSDAMKIPNLVEQGARHGVAI